MSEQPLLDKWFFFNKDNPAPEQFLRFGFYSLIAASLQRRVWLGSELHPLYPNLYIMLVGKPGIGKGLVIKQIAPILKHWKIGQTLSPDALKKSQVKEGEVSKEMLETMAAQKAEVAEMIEELKGTRSASNPKEEKLVIPVAADAITYEALCKSMSKSFRAINYLKYDPISKQEKTKVYGHSSLSFCLEETASLFRKKTEDIVNFLLQAYDCGDYTYETKTQGNDYIKRCCLNFLGGTTPDFMQQVFNDALLNQGFSSRTFFIYAANNRFYRLNMAEYSAEQLEARQDIINKVKLLTMLYGQCQLSEDAMDFLKHWWEVVQSSDITVWRKNLSTKLDAYYNRKQIHVMKLATVLHFADVHIDIENPRATNMIISLDTVKTALAQLEKAEETMHYALNLTSANPLSAVAKKILRYIESNPEVGFNFTQLLVEFWEELPNGEVDLGEVIKFLLVGGKISPTSDTPVKYVPFKPMEPSKT